MGAGDQGRACGEHSFLGRVLGLGERRNFPRFFSRSAALRKPCLNSFHRGSSKPGLAAMKRGPVQGVGWSGPEVQRVGTHHTAPDHPDARSSTETALRSGWGQLGTWGTLMTDWGSQASLQHVLENALPHDFTAQGSGDWSP